MQPISHQNLDSTRLKGRVVLVSGASRGIGAAIAYQFAKHGAHVVVNYLKQKEMAEQVARGCIELGGDGYAVQADVRSESEVNTMMDQIQQEFGRLDVLVNNAFAPYQFDPDNRKRFWETQWDDYQNQIDGAVRSCFNMCQAALPLMRQKGGGSVVNLTTNLMARPLIAYHDYATAKAALHGFTRQLAADLGPLGIRVNAIAPGLVQGTQASHYTTEAVRDQIVRQTPLGRIATPDDVAAAVFLLASDEARFITGQLLHVDGGLVMH
jgi:3-oxoacyl-[acyl-carrier protein] reductase